MHRASLQRQRANRHSRLSEAGRYSKAPAFQIQIDETNLDAYSQTVALTLTNLAGQTAIAKPRVIVIDSDPFLVAAIDYQQLTGTTSSNIVAL